MLALWSWDITRDRFHWSTALASMTGSASLAGHQTPLDDVLAMLHPDDREAAGHALRGIVDHPAELELHVRIILPNGVQRWLALHGEPVAGSTDGALSIQGMVLDETSYRESAKACTAMIESLAAERQELIAERTRFQTVLENLPVGVILADAPSGAIRFNNDFLRTLLNREPDYPESPAEYTGLQAWHPDGSTLILADWPLARALTGETVTGAEIRFAATGGEHVATRVSAVPIADALGKVFAAVAVVEDVTVAHRAAAEREHILARLQGEQAELTQERGILNAILDQLPIGISITRNVEGGSGDLIVNRALRHITATIATEQPKLTDFAIFTICREESEPLLIEDLPLARAARGEHVLAEQLMVTRPDGRELILSVTATPVYDDNGSVIAAVSIVDDVTERGRLMNELANERALLESIIQQIPVGIVIADSIDEPNRRPNEAMDRIFQGEMPRDDETGDHDDAVIFDRTGGIFRDPEPRRADGSPYPRADRPIARALNGETTTGEHMIVAQASGQDAMVRVNAGPVRGTNGTVIAAVAIVEDATEQIRVQAERERLLIELDAQRTLLTAILQQLPSGVIVVEAPSGREILSNEQVIHVLGHPAVGAANAGEFRSYGAIHSDGTPYTAAEYPIVRAIREGVTVRDDKIMYRPHGGTLRWLSVNAAPVRDDCGEIVAGVVSFTNITDQHRQQQMNEVLAEAGVHLAMSLDLDTMFQQLGEVLVPALGDVTYVHLLEPDSSIRHVATVASDPEMQAFVDVLLGQIDPIASAANIGFFRVLRTREPELIVDASNAAIHEIDFVTDDETLRRALRQFRGGSNVCVPLIARGHLLGALTISTLGDRRLDEHDLQFVIELGRRAALAIDNARLFARTQESVLERDQLLATVSHDLKNPLAALGGRIQMLERWGARITDDDMRARISDGLSAAIHTAERMAAMLDEIQDATQLRSGEDLQLTVAPVDVVELTTQVVDDAAQAMAQRDVLLTKPERRLVVAGDSSRLSRAIANIIGNALKFSQIGAPVEITIAHRSENIPSELPADHPDGWVSICVQDYGIGIPPTDLPFVFEQYRRGTNTGAVQGSGIGLAGSRQIIVQHGGDILAESDEGQGSTFTIWLPVNEL